MNAKGKEPLDLEVVRAKLAAAGGRSYWRSLEELAGTDAFDEMLHREFPRHASEWSGALDRRSFLKLMAASLALAGLLSLAACSRGESAEAAARGGPLGGDAAYRRPTRHPRPLAGCAGLTLTSRPLPALSPPWANFRPPRRRCARRSVSAGDEHDR